MAKRRFPQTHANHAPLPELEHILRDLESADEHTRASAVRALCPCRGTEWGVPIFPRVWEMRNDPSPVVRHAVRHDLGENPDWGERHEARRLEGLCRRHEMQQAQAEIDEASTDSEVPAPHSLAWRMRRRPRVRRRY
jgi:hypothetical protein